LAAWKTADIVVVLNKIGCSFKEHGKKHDLYLCPRTEPAD